MYLSIQYQTKVTIRFQPQNFMCSISGPRIATSVQYAVYSDPKSLGYNPKMKVNNFSQKQMYF